METKFYLCPICGNIICKSDVVGVYEYCNLHGLWYKEME